VSAASEKAFNLLVTIVIATTTTTINQGISTTMHGITCFNQRKYSNKQNKNKVILKANFMSKRLCLGNASNC